MYNFYPRILKIRENQLNKLNNATVAGSDPWNPEPEGL
jgi:hypothetical protein